MKAVASIGLDTSSDLDEELWEILALVTYQGSNPIQDTGAAIRAEEKGDFTAHICYELMSTAEEFPMRMMRCIVQDRAPQNMKEEAYNGMSFRNLLFII